MKVSPPVPSVEVLDLGVYKQYPAAMMKSSIILCVWQIHFHNMGMMAK